MNRYSIKDLERLSGIKAHTLRIWEQRYNVLNPERTDTNIRYYSDVDLRKILNISLLNKNGWKISKIAELSEDEIFDEVQALTEHESNLDNQIDALGISMVELDERRFEKILSGSILRHGFEKTMINVIFPFLEKVGNMWMTGTINPAQEHFISNMIRQKLLVAIDGQVASDGRDGPLYMLFTPNGEYHELGLLFMNYLIRTRKSRSVYLGASVPIDDLKTIYDIHSPSYLVVYMTTRPTEDELVDYLTELVARFPQAEVIAAGHPARNIADRIPKGVTLLMQVKDAIALIEKAKSTGKYFSQN